MITIKIAKVLIARDASEVYAVPEFILELAPMHILSR